MQDPSTMSFAGRAAAKDEQIRLIAQAEQNEARLKKELADQEARRDADEAYLVKLALADAAANQRILELYSRHLPPPAPPPPPPAPPPPPPAPAETAAPIADAAVDPVVDAGTAVTGPVAEQAADPAVTTLS